LRLRRTGKKKMPQYHIVASDSRVARDGKFLEVVGRYDPLKRPALVETKDQRVLYWLKNGAQATDTVRSLFQRTGLWYRWSLMKRGKDEAAVAAEMEKWQMGQADKAQRAEARRTRRSAARRAARKGQGAEGAAAAPAQA
jgi:small subunit ribosomal protein S16